MLTLFGMPLVGGKMMVKGDMMREVGPLGNLFMFFHVVTALLMLTLLFLAVVYLWKKIEMMSHEMDHHHDHSKKGN